MFSEYASRFLAQSQSRVASRPDELQRTGRARPNPRQANPSSGSFLRTGDPYRPGTSQISNFPFASRTSVQPAPLFHSAADEFREEDDEAEREREIADFYALQRSRRHFGDSNLKESSELEDSDRSGYDEGPSLYDERLRNGQGIKSSWRGEKGPIATHKSRINPVAEMIESEAGPSTSSGNIKAKGNLVDVGLEDSFLGNPDGEHVHSGDEPPVQRFRERNSTKDNNFGPNAFGPSDDQPKVLSPRASSSTNSFNASISPIAPETSMHDTFWGQLFVISLAALFATAFLVYLHTSSPSGDKSKWGDTIYLTVHRSFFLLGIYTLVSISVSLVWLALLRSYVRILVHVIIVAVPSILYSFSLYPFISSFKGVWHGSSVQDKFMRWGSIVPFVLATLWIYNVVRGRQSVGKAIGILEFACRILAANPELLALGLAILVCVVSWTWIWMLMFTRVFLGGHFNSGAGPKSFIINLSSWWLGVYFVVIYIWSIGVIAGIQRAVTAATVSQWYFHRLASPAPTSRQIVQAAMVHATTTLFGTICLSRILGLIIRLPLIVLPGRISSVLSLFAYSLIPTPIAFLTNPLSLTYGAIHSQPLAASARGLSQMTILKPSTASASLNPRAFTRSSSASTSLLSYRLSKLILYAARLMMSLALGFGGWVTTARSLATTSGGNTIRGSLYAYVVGLIAGTIGWSTLGAIEGIIADIVDAAVICWASEVGIYGREARYCREAGWLFGDSNEDFSPEYHHV
ncbi:hypothetical protein N7495_008906 [Penicillium taxi]|uniref:uncharacterized protein n=1 Tax=Penicillium taxi TaxID=168475 RepID=UPI0025458180|nr:uncharacterized protein N7495_008906 [Penicillium taxi]KAJ5888865.1 hypothetical protein N7495_008906 [Penicillium taxi]